MMCAAEKNVIISQALGESHPLVNLSTLDRIYLFFKFLMLFWLEITKKNWFFSMRFV